MIIYGASASPFVRKVLVAAAEKGIAVESRPFKPRERPADFLEASPFGKIPALRDGDFTLADSSAIIHYFEALQPDPPLIPAEPKARGKAIWYEEFADTILTPVGVKIVFNRFVAPRLLGIEGDAAAADKAEHEDLPPLCDYLERAIPEDRYLAGGRLTLADIAVGSIFASLQQIGTSVERARHPRLAGYIDSILGRTSFANLMAEERHIFAADPA